MRSYIVFCLSGLLLTTHVWSESTPTDDYTGYEPPPSSINTSTYEAPVPATRTDDSVTAGDYFPSEISYEYMGPMDIKSTDSDISITNIYASFRLIRATTGKWAISTSLATRWTWLNSRGPENPIDVDRTYTTWLNVTGRYKYSESSQFILGLNPQLSTDFDVASSDNFNIGAMAMWGQALSRNFFFTLGVVYAPQYPQLVVMPFFGFSWHMPSGWKMSLEETKFQIVNARNENFRWGPFCSWHSGSWLVKRHKEAQNFRVSSMASGLTLDFAPLKNKKIRFITDVGWTFANEIRFYNKSGSHLYEKYKMDPGFFMKISMSKEF